MGNEAFQVVLRGNVPLAEARALLREDSRVGDASNPGQLDDSDYLVFDDGSHIIEMELSESAGRTTLSLRFALCHPDSIDGAFSNLAEDLAKGMAASVSIMAEPPPGMRGDFPPGDLSGFSESVVGAIALDRALWIAEFGGERANIDCNEAMRRFVLREHRDDNEHGSRGS